MCWKLELNRVNKTVDYHLNEFNIVLAVKDVSGMYVPACSGACYVMCKVCNLTHKPICFCVVFPPCTMYLRIHFIEFTSEFINFNYHDVVNLPIYKVS